MSIYCGTDIIEVARIKEAIENNEKFKYEIYTSNEIIDIDSIKNDNFKYQRYAGRFAAKEAVYKALSKILYENNVDLQLKDIEIINDINLNRRPKVNIYFTNNNCNITNNIDIDISISHIKENAIAMCVIKER